MHLKFFHKHLLFVIATVIIVAIGFSMFILLKTTPHSNMLDMDRRQVRDVLDSARAKLDQGQVDSAVILYSVVAVCSPESRDDSIMFHRAVAFNNMGYAQLYCKHDYINAYSNFLNARTIAQEIGYTELLPYIYINLANIDVENNQPEALNMYKQAFHCADDVSNQAIKNIALNNMINLAVSEGCLEDISQELNRYSAETHDSTMLWLYSRYNCEAARLLMQAQNQQAAQLFRDAADHVDTDLTPGRYEIQALGNCAIALMAQGDTLAAIDIFDHINALAYRENTPRVRYNIYKMLSNIYANVGDEQTARLYHYRHLDLSDSIYNFSMGYALKNVESQNEINQINRDFRDLGHNYRQMRLITWAIVIVLVIIIAFSIVTYRQKLRKERLLKSLYIQSQRLQKLETNYDRYKTSSLATDEKETYAKRLTSIAENSPRIFEVGFTIEQLAELADLRPKVVSQVINEKWQLNFNAWLNVYRCREASHRLSSPEYAAMTIEAVAESVGFRNRSHFAAVFKSATGMTPAEYRRAARLVN